MVVHRLGGAGAAERASVVFRGEVQGVGFRFRTRRIAEGYKITGFVKNCTNGSVQVEAEGDRAEVAAFLKDLDEQMSFFIRDKTLDWQPTSGEFAGFTIRF